MLSLSTSWNSARHTSGYELIDEVKSIGFDTVELGFALTERIVKDILSLKEDSKIKVVSLHNICPLPKEIEPDEASPDYYSLASPDEEERALAVEAATHTIACARRFEARAVVLHTGRVQVKDRMRGLADVVSERSAFDALRSQMVREREEKKDGYLDNVIRSLGALIPYAKEMGVALAIENRYYYREIPLIEELEEIFKNFKAGDIFYWHDVGHGQVFENLGLAKHVDYLERFQNRLLGMHLHDIIYPITDHRPPGKGSFDFRIVKPYVSEDTIKVLEVHQPATPDEVRGGAAYLGKFL